MDEPEILDPQYARVEQPFGVDPPTMHCPLCGKTTFETRKGKYKFAPCEHLVFILDGENEVFSYKSKDFKKRAEGVKCKELTRSTFRGFLQKLGYMRNLLVIEITYGGQACGPVYFTDVYGYDYGSLDEDADDEECLAFRVGF